jgi:hypothetical protein
MRDAQRWPRVVALAVGIAVVAALSAAPAGASVTLGRAVQEATSCSGGYTWLGTVSPPPPAAQYTAPSAGVITEWSHFGGNTGPAQMRFKVARPAGGNNYTIVGRSHTENPWRTS